MSIIIKARDARLSILGYQPEVERIYWSKLPTNLPAYGQNLDLTGSEITAVYVNGEEAVVTDYCTFTPPEGTEVPNEATMTVTAIYTARSGKIVKADALLPVAVPAYLRIVVPYNVEAAKESGYFITDNYVATNIVWKEWYGWHDVRTYLFWTRLDEVVRITEVEPTYSMDPDSYYVSTWPGYYGHKLNHSINEVTYDRYYTPTSHGEVTCNAVKILAEYTIYGVTLEAETYLEVDYIDHLELVDKPSTCPVEGSSSVTLAIINVKTVFLSGGYIIGWKRNHQFNYPRYDPGYDTQAINIGGQNSGSATLLHSTFSGSSSLYQKFKYDYSCDEGRVNWTDPNDND